jgi:hypothetical protein
MTAGLPSIDKIAELLGGEVRGNGEVLAPGPGHTSHDRSLSVRPDNAAPNGFLVHSFAGDDPFLCRNYVLGKLGGRLESERKKSNGSNGAPWKVISEHIYRDEHGAPYLKVRKCLDGDGRKQYPQFHLENGQWVKGKPEGPKIPFGLPTLIAAPLNATIYFCEGEKDSDALAKLGFISTTVSEGAHAAWDSELTKWFRGRPLVVVPDADKPGRAHAEKVAKALNGVAASVRILDLYPDRNDGSDVSDFLKDDRAGSRLAKLAKDAPEWEESPNTGGTRSSARRGVNRRAKMMMRSIHTGTSSHRTNQLRVALCYRSSSRRSAVTCS